MTLTQTVLDAIDWAQQEAGTNIDLKTLMSRQRYAHLVRIRRLAMWRLRTEYRRSFPWITKAMGMADHATVMHHIQLENYRRGYAANYPLDDWREQERIVLTLNIEVINTQIQDGQNEEDVAYLWRIPLSKMRAALHAHRLRITGDNPVSHKPAPEEIDTLAPVQLGA